MSGLQEIGALWKGKTKDGKVMLSGKFDKKKLDEMQGDVLQQLIDGRILVFVNKYKDQPNKPDYRIILGEDTKRDVQQEQKAPEDDFSF